MSRETRPRRAGTGTTAVHGGETRPRPGDALTTPVFLTATYAFRDTDEVVRYMRRELDREEYGRYGNPTQRVAEAKCAALEGAEAALACSTGMAAVTTLLLAVLQSGHHVVLTNDCYRRTRYFCLRTLRRFGVEVSVVEPELDAVEAAITSKTRLLISESPTNPYLKVIDLARFAEIGKRHGVMTVVDSTLATPVNQRPISHGIDVIVHSATKYLAGHNDTLGGVILGRRPLVDAVREFQGTLGTNLDPHAAYLLIRGLKTLPLRVERQNETALAVAERLAAHPRVERVHYPGLPTHPGHDVARRQMRGFGGVVSFEVKGDARLASRVVDGVQIPQIAPSLGGVESLIEQPSYMSFFDLSPEERAAIGIRDNLIRLSVGLEDREDLIDDLVRAIDQA